MGSSRVPTDSPASADSSRKPIEYRSTRSANETDGCHPRSRTRIGHRSQDVVDLVMAKLFSLAFLRCRLGAER